MKGNGIKTIGFSEIDKYAIAVLKYHWPEIKNYGNITAIQGTEFPRPNLITFGSPCQDLSIAGKRAGLKGGRSGLFFEATRLINNVKPDYFIFENVKGLFSSNDGKDFEVVLREFTDIGYDCQWQLLNTVWFLPQNRERVFVVGHLRGQCRPEIFPVGEGNEGYNEEIQKGIMRGRNKNITGSLDTRGVNAFDRSDLDRLIYCPLVASTIRSEHHNTADVHFIIHNMQPRSGNPKIGGTGHLTKTDGTTYNIDTGNTNAVEFKDGGIRRLTPVECERLQGLPDNWTKVPGVSESQRYKLCGNGVSIPVVEEIVKRLVKSIKL